MRWQVDNANCRGIYFALSGAEQPSAGPKEHAMIKIDNPNPTGRAAKYSHFEEGDIREFLDKAERLLDEMGLRAAEVNERLLRHYVTMKAVDNPEREGRKGRFGYRHLLQFVVVRQMLKDRHSLADIAQFTRFAPISELERVVDQQTRMPTPAELYLRSQASGEFNKLFETAPDPYAVQRSYSGTKGAVGLVDIIHELRKTADHVNTLVEQPMKVIREQMAQNNRILETAKDQKTMIEEALKALMDEHRRETQRLIADQIRPLQDVVDQHRADTSKMLTRLERAVVALEKRDREMSQIAPTPTNPGEST
jgi:gas vesicle protein